MPPRADPVAVLCFVRMLFEVRSSMTQTDFNGMYTLEEKICFPLLKFTYEVQLREFGWLLM